jgi:hypothetical protein
MSDYTCFTEGCDKPSRARIGRYAYCDECRAERAAERPAPAPIAPRTTIPSETFAAKVARLNVAARKADVLRKKALALTGKALAAKDEADSAAAEVAAIARELGA